MKRGYPILVEKIDGSWQPVHTVGPGGRFIAANWKLGLNVDLMGYLTRQGAAEAARLMNEAAGRCPCCGAKERTR